MKPSSNSFARLRRQSIVLIVVSLVFGLFVIAFMAGLNATSYETTDAAGRTMGFNDRFSGEHYRIILGNMSWRGTFKEMWEGHYLLFGSIRGYEWLFVAMHGFALGLLVWARQEKWVIRFFLLQPLLFPLGILGIYALPLMVIDAAWFRTADREAFVDVPFVWVAAHGCWVIVSTIIAWRFFRYGRRAARSALAAASLTDAHPATL